MAERREPEEIGAIVGFHIRLAHRAVYRHFTEHFADPALTPKDVSVLWLTQDHPASPRPIWRGGCGWTG